MLPLAHGGKDPGAVYQGREEKNDNLRLALAVGQILEDNSIDVEYTRTTDVYNSPIEKATMANNAGADYFVSIHRNAAAAPNTGSGIETLVYNNSGVKVDMARNINRNLEEIGWSSYGVIERPNLVVLRRTKMPAVLVEVGFLDNDADNKKFDTDFDVTANAIAMGILETVNEDPVVEVSQMNMPKAPDVVLYRVQLGAFNNANLAEQMVSQLQYQSYPAFVIYKNGFYKVQVGAFRMLDNAVKMEMRLRQSGYNTFVTTE